MSNSERGKDCPDLPELMVYIFFPDRLSSDRREFLDEHTKIGVCRFCFFDKVRFSAEVEQDESERWLTRWIEQTGARPA